MPSGALSGQAASFSYSTDGSGSGGGAWHAVTGVIEMKNNKIKVPMANSTGLTDTWQTKIPTTPDGGTFSVVVQSNTTNLTLEGTLSNAGLWNLVMYYKFLDSNGKGRYVPAVLTSSETSYKYSDQLTLTWEFETTGAVVSV